MTQKTLREHKAELLERWMKRLEESKLLMAKRDALHAELDAWLSFMSDALEKDDDWSAGELYKLVALHARALGVDGRPASAALMQVILLEETLSTLPDSSWKCLTNEMVRVVTDAHALGQSQRMRSRFHQEIKRFSPVFRLGDVVIGFLLGPMEREVLDAICGRLLRERTRADADIVVLDLFGAEEENEIFYRTIAGVLRSDAAIQMSLVLTGMRDQERTTEGLKKAGCDLSRIQFMEDINSFIASQLV